MAAPLRSRRVSELADAAGIGGVRLLAGTESPSPALNRPRRRHALMALDFLGLEAFLSIAERGSFRKAAAHLNLSQTALSHRIRKFEEGLGLRLLSRSTRQVTLTPAGIELAGRARGPVEALVAVLGELRAGAGPGQGSVTIGCLPTIAMHHVPRLLGEFARLHPEVTVRVLDNSATEIAEGVARGEAEFGITIVSAHRMDLDIVPLMTEAFVLACPVADALSHRLHVAWSELEGRKLVRVAPQTGNRAILDEALGARREAMDWHYEVQHLATAISMVEAGLALAVVPRLAVDAAGSPGVAAVPLRDPSVVRRLGVVSRRGAALSPAAEALLALLRAHFRGAEGRMRKTA